MDINKIAQYTLVMMIIAFSIVFSNYMKNSVYQLEDELKGINQNIQNDIQSIHILNAEWSKLNNPSRLRTLAATHAHLNPIRAEQIINYSALPFSYESSEAKKEIARKNIAVYAKNNREIKKLANARR